MEAREAAQVWRPRLEQVRVGRLLGPEAGPTARLNEAAGAGVGWGGGEESCPRSCRLLRSSHLKLASRELHTPSPGPPTTGDSAVPSPSHFLAPTHSEKLRVGRTPGGEVGWGVRGLISRASRGWPTARSKGQDPAGRPGRYPRSQHIWPPIPTPTKLQLLVTKMVTVPSPGSIGK